MPMRTVRGSNAARLLLLWTKSESHSRLSFGRYWERSGNRSHRTPLDSIVAVPARIGSERPKFRLHRTPPKSGPRLRNRRSQVRILSGALSATRQCRDFLIRACSISVEGVPNVSRLALLGADKLGEASRRIVFRDVMRVDPRRGYVRVAHERLNVMERPDLSGHLPNVWRRSWNVNPSLAGNESRSIPASSTSS